MKDLIKREFMELIKSIFKGLKIFVVYIVPSTLVAVLVMPELMELVKSDPRLLAYAPIINTAFITIADLIKKRLPEENVVKKVL